MIRERVDRQLFVKKYRDRSVRFRIGFIGLCEWHKIIVSMVFRRLARRVQSVIGSEKLTAFPTFWIRIKCIISDEAASEDVQSSHACI